MIGIREAGVALLRWHAGRQGIVLHVSQLGKAKTCLQMGAIVALMLVPDPAAAVGDRAADGGRLADRRLRAAVRLGRSVRQTSSKSAGSSRRVSSMYSRM